MRCECCGKDKVGVIEADGLAVCLDCYVAETDTSIMVGPSVPMASHDEDWSSLDAQPVTIGPMADDDVFGGLL